MKTSELAKDMGFNKLHVGRVRRKVSPDHEGGPLDEWEIRAIKKELGVLTNPDRIKVQGIYGDSRYPNFVECHERESDRKVTVQIPPSYEPEMFIGKEIWVEQREYAPGRFVYSYNPYKQDE
jgi:hypothetical protein